MGSKITPFDGLIAEGRVRVRTQGSRKKGSKKGWGEEYLTSGEFAPDGGGHCGLGFEICTPPPGFEINFKNPLQAGMPPFRSRGSTEAVTDEAFICLTLQSLKPLRQANHW